MSLKGTWAQIYREDATGLGYTVAPTTMPLTISDDSNDIRDVGPCCGYEDYYAESPMLPTGKIERADSGCVLSKLQVCLNQTIFILHTPAQTLNMKEKSSRIQLKFAAINLNA